MALPKRKISSSRQGKRRSHWKAEATKVVECPQCHDMKMPHRACPNCGYYKGRPVISAREK